MSRYAKAYEGAEAGRLLEIYRTRAHGRAAGEQDWLWLLHEAPCWEFIFLTPYWDPQPGAEVRARFRRVRSPHALLPWRPDDELVLWTAEGLDQPRAVRLYASDGRRWARLIFEE